MSGSPASCRKTPLAAWSSEHYTFVAGKMPALPYGINSTDHHPRHLHRCRDVFFGRSWGSIRVFGGNGFFVCHSGGDAADGVGAEPVCCVHRRISILSGWLFLLAHILAICDNVDTL